jgi:Phage major capsid protein E
MAYNDPDLVHYDQFLTNYSTGYQNEDLVTSALFPSLRVGDRTGKLYVFNRENWRADFDDIRVPGGEANEVPPIAVAERDFHVVEHSLEGLVTDEEVEESDNQLTPAQDTTDQVTSWILMKREQTMVTQVTTAANYASGMSVTLSGTDQFNDYTNSNPIAVIKTGMRAVHQSILKTPNVAVMGKPVWDQLEDHPDFIERIKYSQEGVTTEQIIARILGFSGRIYVSKAAKLTNALGQAETVGYMFPKDIVLAYVAPSPGRKIQSFGYEFVWPYRGGPLQTVERWREEKRKTDIVRVSRRYNLHVTSIDSIASGKIAGGYLIKNAVA